ncbi:DUF3108 domain-containing protein [Neptuniibacter marinus]|uniref:DUF3108 domain-containing protein n=1 Tax=Neptuniibacter marinus TaxID=1806670 RepID=UPI0008350FE9|nr:DUF3108 domain-containing protein [Neptuniibacter marinus]
MFRISLRTPLILLASLFFLTTPLHADVSVFKPFTASYELDWDGPISVSGDTIRQLKKSSDDSWTFESKANSMFASIFEKSHFQWNNKALSPIHYTFKRSVFGKKRNAEISFDWENNRVTNEVDDKPWQMDVTPGVQDKISYQMLLQQELAKGETSFTYQVADGGILKEYKFQVDGQEVIEAPIGIYKTIRVKRVREANSPRQTYIWFAPELNYQIIKLKQIEKKDKAYTLLLKELNSN